MNGLSEQAIRGLEIDFQFVPLHLNKHVCTRWTQLPSFSNKYGWLLSSSSLSMNQDKAVQVRA
jgi:hypothetical protein